MTMTEFIGNPQRLRAIGGSPQFTDDLIGSFRENDCIDNSRRAALSNNDLMVEGVVITLSSGNVVSINAHCWNKTIEGTYYDVTKDYVWTRPEFIERLQREGCSDVSYEYLACKEYLPTEANIDNNGVLNMHHTYKDLICFMTKRVEDKKS